MLKIIVFTLAFIPSIIFGFGNNTVKQIDQINNNTGVDIILNPISSVKVNSLTGGKALQSGALKELEESAVTNVELGYVSGVTSSIQTQLDSKTPLSRIFTMTSPLFIDGVASGDLSADRTFSIQQSNTTTDGYLSSTDWNTFNNKQSAITILPIVNGGTGSATQNFVDLTTAQSIAGVKTFTGQLVATSTTDSSHPAPSMTAAQRDAIAAPISGDLIYNLDTLQMNIYDGTVWGALAGSGGTGEFNYLVGDASDFETSLGGWAGDTSLAALNPQASTMRGSAYLRLSKGAINAQNQSVKSPVFTLDNADLGHKIAIEFDYSAPVAYNNGSMKIEVIQDPLGTPVATVTDLASIPSGDGRHLMTFIADSVITDYQIRITQVTTELTVYSINFDYFKIYPFIEDPIIKNLAAISDWQSYTPTFTNLALGTGGITRFFKKIVGDQQHIKGYIKLGTGGSFTGKLIVSLPSNIDYSKEGRPNDFARLKGSVRAYDLGGIGVQNGGEIIGNASSVNSVYFASTGKDPYNATQPFTWGASDELFVDFSYSALGFSSGTNVVISKSTLLKVKATINSSQVIPNNVTTTIIYNIESEDNYNSYDNSTGIFTSPKDACYLVSAGHRFSSPSSVFSYVSDINGFILQSGSTSTFGEAGGSGSSHICLSTGGTIQVHIFQNSGGNAILTNFGNTHLEITEQPINGTIIGTFGDCQTKTLSANISVFGDVAELSFTGLTIGARYRARGILLHDQGNVFRFIHNSVTQGQAFNQTTGQINQYISTPVFTATATTLIGRKDTSITTYGNNGLDKTWVELCEISKGVSTRW